MTATNPADMDRTHHPARRLLPRRAVTILLAAALVAVPATARAEAPRAKLPPNTLFLIGTPDARAAEFGHVEEGPEAFKKGVPDPLVYTVGKSEPRDWPYIHPSERDSWAGGRAHTYQIRFDADRDWKQPLYLVVGICGGSTIGRSDVVVSVGNTALAEQAVPTSTVAPYYDRSTRGTPDWLLFEIPPGLVHKGASTISIRLLKQAWMIYDYVALRTRGETLSPGPLDLLQADAAEREARGPLPVSAAGASRDGFVEFHGGDRLPGQIVGCRPPRSDAWGEVPARLTVRPDVQVFDPFAAAEPVIMVAADQVRRIVRSGAADSAVGSDGTLTRRDGSAIAFTHVRWRADEVQVLTPEGIQTVPLVEVAELTLPPPDPWEHYVRELAALDPQGAARLATVETADGAVLTTSTSRIRFLARPVSWGQDVLCWVLQPAWSRQPFWIREGNVRSAMTFEPDGVPLTRIPPSRFQQESPLGGHWTWRKNGSVTGGRLKSGGQSWDWGFGVHATAELSFPLPSFARALQTRIGLDHSAGDGGCARGVVYADNRRSKPLFASQFLVGSQKVADTGRIAMPPSSHHRTVTLWADDAHRGRPDDADPFDVRDHLDWLEPVLVLDRAPLREEVEKHAYDALPGWSGWQVTVERGGPPPLVPHFDEAAAEPRFRPAVRTAGRALTFSRQVQLTDQTRWLYLLVAQAEETTPGRIEVALDGRSIAELDVPPPDDNRPRLVPLDRWLGQDVKIEVVFRPGDAVEMLYWDTLAVVPRKTRIDWTPIQVAAARIVGKPGSESRLVVEPDGSLLAVGPYDPVQQRFPEEFEIAASVGVTPITGFRLEALADPRLPYDGPGRNKNGNFHLAQFAVTRPPEGREPIRGRYVRLELPGEKRRLTVSEVEVLAPPPLETEAMDRLIGTAELPPGGPATRDEILAILVTLPEDRTDGQSVLRGWFLDSFAENLALDGKASQSSTDGRNHADRAVDGVWEQTVSTTREEDDPWWEVDLGTNRDIDRIVIWTSPQETSQDRFGGLVTAVLDEDRQEVFRRRTNAEPLPALEISRRAAPELPLAAADASTGHKRDEYRVSGSLVPDTLGWATGGMGRSQAAVYTLAEPLDARGTDLRFHLRHCNGPVWQTRSSLGRFRLLSTTAPPPLEAEPIGVVVPLVAETEEDAP